jgi:hypothetical protein
MKLVNEALRMFLAISALILTAMLTSPDHESQLAIHSGLLPEKKVTQTRPQIQPAKRTLASVATQRSRRN